MCNMCDTFHMRLRLADENKKETFHIALKDHLEQADMWYTSKAQDKEEANGDKKKEKSIGF